MLINVVVLFLSLQDKVEYWIHGIQVNFKLLIHKLGFELNLVNSVGINCVILWLQRGRMKTKGNAFKRFTDTSHVKRINSFKTFLLLTAMFAHVLCTVHRYAGPAAEDKDY